MGGFVAAGCATMATVLIFSGYMIDPVEMIFVYAGAILSGIAIPFLILLWAGLLKTYDETMIEFSIPAAFLIALALYLPLVAFKNILTVMTIAALPLLSVLLAIHLINTSTQKQIEIEHEFSETADSSTKEKTQNKPEHSWSYFSLNTPALLRTGGLFFIIWFNFAFFRSCISPTYFTDRFDHYLLPFACAGILSITFCLATLYTAKQVRLFETYRWMLPVVCLGYAMVIPSDPLLSKLAFTTNFVALAGIQLCFIIVIAKCSKKHNIPLGWLLFPLLAFIGIGIACGSGLGLWVLYNTSNTALQTFSPFIVVGLVSAVMMWGVDSDTFIKNSKEHNKLTNQCATTVCLNNTSAKIIDNVAAEKAKEFALVYALSPRETEILGFLLAGRSRPFTRDTLILSLNTVNTHVRNIYTKTGVHSQQELLTLAREGTPELPKVAR